MRINIILTFVSILVFSLCISSQTEPDNAGVSAGIRMAHEAQELREAGKIDEAIALYNKVIAAHPDLEMAYFGRSLCYQAKNEYEKELADLNEALKLRPGVKLFLYNRIKANLNLSKYSDVLNDATILIKEADHPEIRYYRAVAFYELRDLDEAVEDINVVISKEPLFAESYMLRAGVNFEKRNWQTALTRC